MNSREYIESGVLELYVSGLLSVEEMRDVELKACQYPEIKTELESLQMALERFAMKHAMAPRPEVKERILKMIEQSEGEGNKKSVRVREIGPAKPNYMMWLAAASIALLALMSALSLYYSSLYNKSREQVAQLQDQQLGIQKQLDDIQLAMTSTANELQLLKDPNTVRVTMNGTEKHPESIAVIYWNKATKAVYLDIKSLPPTSPDKQYQLWAIDPAKGPVSAGVFDVKTGALLQMMNASDAAAFAVTLEPRGGSVNPTLDQMYVVGNVAG